MKTSILASNPARLTLAVGLVALSAGIAVGDWGAPRGGVDGTNRAAGVAQIAIGDGNDPGFSWSVDLAPTRLNEVMLQDFNGDGEPEVILLASGSMTALNPQTGLAWWSSLNAGLDGLVGVGELDGDPTTTELVGTSNAARGGLQFVDAQFGGLQGAVTGLPSLSGVMRSEVVLADLDNDGVDEIIYPAGLFGLGSLFISDPSPGLASSSLLEVSFGGYANTTPPRVGDLLGTGSPVIALNQGAQFYTFEVCAPADAGATCDDGPGTLCLCGGRAWFGLHPTYSFGPSWVLDVDNDGVDEVIEVPNHPLYTKAISVFDLAAGIASGSANADDTRQWYRRYMAADPVPMLEPLSEGPVDLDGDGDLEIIVSFFNNDSTDTEADGTTANEDGIDHAGGLSIGIYDLTNGDLLAFELDAVAYGTVDLDDDGDLEIVTSPSTPGDYAFETGLTGYEMDCTGGNCTLTAAWTAPDRTLHPALSSLEDIALPNAELHTIEANTGGSPELLVYFDDVLEAITADGSGGFIVVASRLLLADEDLIASDPDTNTALITRDEDATVLDGSLATVGVPIPLPSRGWGGFAAASFDGQTREAPVFGGSIFQTTVSPTSLADADFELLPHFALAADLDGDGIAEAISFQDVLGEGVTDSSFSVRVDSWNSSTLAFETLWTFMSSSELQLDGFNVGGPIHFATGDFDGIGDEDVIFAVNAPGQRELLVLDGDTGVLDATLTPSQSPAVVSPLLIGDYVDGTGAFGTDGIDDVVIQGAGVVELLSVASGVSTSTSTSFFHVVGANADVDGDGDLEMVGTLSATVNNQIEVWDGLGTATPSLLWGPQPLGLPTGAGQVLAVADLDGNASQDLLYITAEAGLTFIAGDTGLALADPVYLAGGALTTSVPTAGTVPISLMVIDVDDDGYEEAIVGATDGWIYAVDVALDDPDAPGLAWTLEAGSAVRALAAADVDGDGFDEILVSLDGGRGAAIDGVGVSLAIAEPAEGACVPSTEFEVSGTSFGIDSVEVFFGGSSVSGDVDASSGVWVGDAEVRGIGTFELQVRGKDPSGAVVVLATRFLDVGIDGDADGWKECGDCVDGDFDADPTINPGADDICEDGIDQNCDGEDAVCGDDDDSAPGDDDDSAGDDDDATIADDDDSGPDGGGCDGGGCDCDAGASSQPMALGWMFLLGGALLRRRLRA